MASSTEVVVTYANIILYAISYQLQRPVEPFLVRSLIHNNQNNTSNTDEEESSNQTYGRLTSFFSFIQTIGSPLIGILLDRIGVRKTSILVYFASALSYSILANATSTTWLFWSKIPTILQHAFLVGQATVASSTAATSDNNNESGGSNGGDKQRAVALGRMTTAYTIGATIGPALGGYLAMGDLFAGARLAIWGSIISVILSIVFLKDHNNSERTEGNKTNSDSQKEHQQSFLQSIHKTLSYLRHPTIGPLLFIKLLNGVSSSAFTTILPLVLVNKLHLDTSQLGYFMSASSLSVAVFASFGISASMSLVGNRSDRLASLGLALRAVSIVCFGGVVSWCLLHLIAADDTSEEQQLVLPTEGLWLATIASIAVSISSHMHATSLTTLTTGAVSVEQRGAILGLEHGLFSLARVVGPPFGTHILSRPIIMSEFMPESGFAGIWGVISACVIMDVILLVCLHRWSSKKDTQLNSDECIGLTKAVDDKCDEHDHSD
mmetsp:Transcript_7165/g.11980  ORF Transcript_7165/g.11980 Transcript_7165/m.11980 type:complete len:493 (-) Transcript_7165:7-1485(-)